MKLQLKRFYKTKCLTDLQIHKHHELPIRFRANFYQVFSMRLIYPGKSLESECEWTDNKANSREANTRN